MLEKQCQDAYLDNRCFRVYDEPVHFWFRLPFRTRLGIIATCLLTFAIVVLLSWYHDPGNFSYRTAWIVPLGAVIFLLWLAWSDVEKIPWWNWLLVIAMLTICMIKPGFWFVGVPIIGYIIFASRKK